MVGAKMTANELADVLENDYWDSRANKVMLEGAKMLRNQQALIENLNGRIKRMIEKQSHYESMAHAGGFEAGRELGMKQERERNNEPVAWINRKGKNGEHGYLEWDKDDEAEINTPLYTHPVKDLTDAEIRTIQDMCHLKNVGYNTFIMRFARAILRKASEK
jgi:hypothetical protein